MVEYIFVKKSISKLEHNVLLLFTQVALLALLSFFKGLWHLLSLCVCLFFSFFLKESRLRSSMQYAISNLLSQTYSRAKRHSVLKLEDLKLYLAMILAVEVPE
jgi:hypothetical protein